MKSFLIEINIAVFTPRELFQVVDPELILNVGQLSKN